MIFHFYIIARYQSLFALELSPKPIDVVFHVNHLEKYNLNRSGALHSGRYLVVAQKQSPIIQTGHIHPPLRPPYTPNTLTLSKLPFLKLSSSGAVALKSCLAVASIVGSGRPFRSVQNIYVIGARKPPDTRVFVKKNKRRTDCTGTQTAIIFYVVRGYR